MSKKNGIGETIFAVVCVVGLVGVLVANEGATWLLWLQSVVGSMSTTHSASNAVVSAVDGSAVGMLVQFAVGFAVVFAVGGGALWMRNRNVVEADADGTPVIDYSSPDWVNVKVIR